MISRLTNQAESTIGRWAGAPVTTLACQNSVYEAASCLKCRENSRAWSPGAKFGRLVAHRMHTLAQYGSQFQLLANLPIPLLRAGR